MIEMIETKPRTRKSEKKRNYEVRAILRRDGNSCLADIATELNVSEVHAWRMVSRLVKRGEVELAYTVPAGGNRRRYYRLTESYLNRLERIRDYSQSKRATETVQREPAPQPRQAARQPWYRRVLGFFSGHQGTAQAAGAHQ